MIARNTANGALSGPFIAKLQDPFESPRIIFRFGIDSTTDLNEALDDSETVIDVDDNSVFSDGDIISVEIEYMLVTDDDIGANQIQVTRAYGLSIADTHNIGQDIYIHAEYDVLDVTDISTDPDFGSSEAVAHLSNADQFWNIFLSDPTNHGNPASIELKFDALAENMYIYRGVVDHVEYGDRDMSIYLYLKDPLDKKLNEVIDPSFGALQLYIPSENPMDTIWAILVTEGEFDSTESQANVDIDWAKFDAVRTKLTAQNLSFTARIPRSHTYRSACQTVLYLASCWAFRTNEGKIGFAYAANDAGGGDDTWTQDHILDDVNGGRVDGNRPYTDASGIVNLQNTAWGYDIDLKTWGGNEINSDGTSQNNYGTLTIVEADYIIWHDDAASTVGGSDWIESIYASPRIYSELLTWLNGIRSEIGDTIDLTDADYGWTNNLMKIERILSINMSDFTIAVLLRE